MSSDDVTQPTFDSGSPPDEFVPDSELFRDPPAGGKYEIQFEPWPDSNATFRRQEELQAHRIG